MKGLLRYAVLKSMRDGSLATMLVAPALMLGAPVIAMLLLSANASRRMEMPAAAASQLAVITGSLMAAMAAFLLFRTEITDRSLGSLLLATRTVLVPLSSTLYGALIGGVTVFTAVIVLGLTNGTWPADLSRFVAQVGMVVFAAAAIASLGVALTRSMAAIMWVYAIVFFSIMSGVPKMAAAPAITLLVVVVCVSIATVLLERACAS